jgi:nucleoside-diphosphate-sugar epimerase
MRIFVAGAIGAIGTRLVPQLIDGGDEVIGTSRSAGKAGRIGRSTPSPSQLGWELRHPSRREGFRAAYAPVALAERRNAELAARSWAS